MIILMNCRPLTQNPPNLVIDLILEMVHRDLLTPEIHEQMVLEVTLEWVVIIEMIHKIEIQEILEDQHRQIPVEDILSNKEELHPSRKQDHNQIPTYRPIEAVLL